MGLPAANQRGRAPIQCAQSVFLLLGLSIIGQSILGQPLSGSLLSLMLYGLSRGALGYF